MDWSKIRSLKIGDDWYDVEVKKNLTDEKRRKIAGEADSEEKKIRINEEKAKAKNLVGVKTLIHEVCHAVCDSFNPAMWPGDDKEKEEAIEHSVEFVSSCIIMICLDNPDQVQEILDAIRKRGEEKK